MRTSRTRAEPVEPSKSSAAPAYLLELDPDLAAGLDPQTRARATRAGVAWTVTVPRGELRFRKRAAPNAAVMVVQGLVLREMWIGDTASAELIGPGDIVHPWTTPDARPFVRRQSWVALEPARLATIDEHFMARVAEFGPIVAELAARSSRRSRFLAAQLLICQLRRVDERLLLLFSVLSERWGRVRLDGTLVPLPLTHETLGRLVGARRPSVTQALTELRARGILERTPRGWLLRNSRDAATLLRMLRDQRGPGQEAALAIAGDAAGDPPYR